MAPHKATTLTVCNPTDPITVTAIIENQSTGVDPTAVPVSQSSSNVQPATVIPQATDPTEILALSAAGSFASPSINIPKHL